MYCEKTPHTPVGNDDLKTGHQPAAVELDSVRLSLPTTSGKVDILRGLSLRVEAGESVAVVGPSGAGKTTMLMVIAGLEPADEGHVRVAGCDLSGFDEGGLARLRRERMGIVFQGFHLAPTMTALENVALPLEFAGQSQAAHRARDELAAVGLADRAGHYPAQLSGGEQQRVAIARALVARPDILLADEPTGNLDEAASANVMELLFRLQHQHQTALILITHNPDHATLAGRVERLENGCMVPSAATG